MKHISNISITFRIILIPFILITIKNGHFLVTTSLAILFGVTALLDRYIAKKYKR